MGYTWGETKIATIKKMFLNNDTITTADLPSMELDRKYATYLNTMASTANEALLRIMSVSRPLIKEYSLTYNIPDSIYDALTFETEAITDTDYVVELDTAHAYYFELDNSAVITIDSYDEDTEVWTTIDTITHTATKAKTYETQKGLITNEDDVLIRMTFANNGYLYNVRNIAMYILKFRTADEIFNCTPKQKYNLKTLITDFYKISSIEFEKMYNTKGAYDSDFNIQGDSVLEIDSKLQGNFIIKYEAYPDKIEDDTLDSYTFTMADEMIVLLPLYIASEVFKDDDATIATQYRNQFELGLQEVVSVDTPQEFANNSNWM